MWKILLYTAGFLVLAVDLLGVRVLFMKGGRITSPNISDKQYRRKKGNT